MRSPLEHDEELVLAIGTISVRWSLMESSLATLVGAIISSDHVGKQAFYALATFSQRLALAERIAVSATQNEKHKAIVSALFAKIGRLWKVRNKLVHNPYVYRIDQKGGGSFTIDREGRDLGEHPSKGEGGPLVVWFNAREEQTPEMVAEANSRALEARKPVSRGFAYIETKVTGERRFISVNTGTFTNHAEALSRRIRQIVLLTKYVDQEVVTLGIRPQPKPIGKYAKLSPRSPLVDQANQDQPGAQPLPPQS